MKLVDFNNLSLAERTCAVFAYGTFLACRQEECYTVVLHYIGNFFGEVYYDKSQERVIWARGFPDASCFDSYLPYIKLSELELDK